MMGSYLLVITIFVTIASTEDSIDLREDIGSHEVCATLRENTSAVVTVLQQSISALGKLASKLNL